MRAFVVVDVPELFQLFVEVRVWARGWVGQPFLQGLVEPFNLALGLGAVSGAVLLGDAQGVELVFEGVPPAPASGEAGGV